MTNDASLCFLKQTLSFQPPAMEILRQRVRLLAEAAPSSAESPQVDPHGPPQALSQSLAPPSQPLGDPLGTTRGLLSWAGSPPTKRPPTFSRITRFTTGRARVHKYKSACSQQGVAGKCAPLPQGNCLQISLLGKKWKGDHPPVSGASCKSWV